jgi:uncharacterized protein
MTRATISSAEIDLGGGIKSHWLMPLGLEWGDRSNLAKHTVGFEESAAVFADPFSLTIADPAHSQAENQCFIIGSSNQGNLPAVVHTERGDSIRVISARRAGKGEREAYEEAS